MSDSGSEIDEATLSPESAKVLRRSAKSRFSKMCISIRSDIDSAVDQTVVNRNRENFKELFDECARYQAVIEHQPSLTTEEKKANQEWSDKLRTEYDSVIAAVNVYLGVDDSALNSIMEVDDVQVIQLQIQSRKRKLEEDIEDSRIEEERRVADMKRNALREQQELEDKLALSLAKKGQKISTHLNAAAQTQHDVAVKKSYVGHGMASSESAPRRSDVIPSIDAWLFEEFKTITAASEGQTLVTMAMINNLKPFDGDARDWPMFIQTFKNMVHDVFPSDAVRLTMLISMLHNRLREGLCQILSSPQAYREALIELRRKYGHPHLVMRTYIHHLTALEPMAGGLALQTFSSQLHGAVSTLQASGYGHELESSLALETLVRKLSPVLIARWGRYVNRILPVIPTLREFDSWVDEQVMAEKNVQPAHMFITPKPSSSASRQDKPQSDKNKTTIHRLQSFNPTVASSGERAPSLSCDVCNATPGHGLTQCSKFEGPVNERVKIVYGLGNCLRCLGRQHVSRDCLRKDLVCKECGQKHHTLVHGGNLRRKQ